ncbi:MAG: hypothetical protein Q9227_009378 [Pyrenula ochraceoflavens]
MHQLGAIPRSVSEKLADGVCKVASYCQSCIFTAPLKKALTFGLEFGSEKELNKELQWNVPLILDSRSGIFIAVLKFALKDTVVWLVTKLFPRNDVPKSVPPELPPWVHQVNPYEFPPCPTGKKCVYTIKYTQQSNSDGSLKSFNQDLVIDQYQNDTALSSASHRQRRLTNPLSSFTTNVDNAITSTPLSSRDDSADTFCSPVDTNDLALVVSGLFQTVILPRFANGDSCVELDVYHPGIGGPLTITEGGAFRIQAQLADVEPTSQQVFSTLDTFQDLASQDGDGAPWKGGDLQGQECYEAYTPGMGRSLDQDVGIPTTSFNTAADSCKAAFQQNVNKPANFQYAKDGWSISYAAAGCTTSFSCSDLFGSSGDGKGGDASNLVGACSTKVSDGVFRGGIIHHMKNGKYCGYLKLDPIP